jgi:phage terminase Nu1 subunit (DNA packaging protein)
MAKAAPDVSLEDFADDHGVTVRTVTNWINEGMPHRDKPRLGRRVVRRQANAWLLERTKRIEARRAEGGLWSRDREAAKKLAVERQIKERELAQLDGKLLSVEQFDELRDRLVGGFAAVVSGQLQPFERRMGLEPDAARALTLEMQTALMRGANQLADALDAEADELEALAHEDPPEVDELEDDEADDADPVTAEARERTPTAAPEPDLFSALGEVPGS